MTYITTASISVAKDFIISGIIKLILLLCYTCFISSNVYCQEAENASNPLAAVSNIDLIAKYYDLDNNSERIEYSLEGATMLNPKLKLKSELHYWDTDTTGHDETDLESLHLKLIYFPVEGKINNEQPYRLAIGIEWIKDLGDTDKGIGTDTDQIAPFVGAAIGVRPGTMVIPLMQHYEGYDNGNVSQTSLRLIALQNFPNDIWGKMDLKVPYDWKNETIASSIEFQLGKSFNKSFGIFIDLQSGIGGDKPYDYATGIGLRFNF